MAREANVEIYYSARPEDCLGCGGPITAGDVVVPAERGWLLCLDCGAGLLIGQPLPAWPAAGPAPEVPVPKGAGWADDPGPAVSAKPAFRGA
jgi:hypothetical protein